MKKLSRPNRRADKRLAIKEAQYILCVKADRKGGGKGFRKPGSRKMW